ncbi:MAG: hypothetical protein ACKVOH_05155 [Chlamydiales bacterium]
MKRFMKFSTIIAVLCGFAPIAVFGNQPTELASYYSDEYGNQYYIDEGAVEEYSPTAYQEGVDTGWGPAWWVTWGALLLAAGGIVAIAVTNNQTTHD